MSEITINGAVYVPKSEVIQTVSLMGLPYKIVRTQSAGVFAGYVKSRTGTEVVMLNARRLWHWQGAATLSELAMNGTCKPSSCKFPCPVSQVELFGVIEIIDVSSEAKATIDKVPTWTAWEID